MVSSEEVINDTYGLIVVSSLCKNVLTSLNMILPSPDTVKHNALLYYGVNFILLTITIFVTELFTQDSMHFSMS